MDPITEADLSFMEDLKYTYDYEPDYFPMKFYRNGDAESGWYPLALNPGDNPHTITSVSSVFLNSTLFTFDLMDNDYKNVDCHL